MNIKKKCPQCGKTYLDDPLARYCDVDGATLKDIFEQDTVKKKVSNKKNKPRYSSGTARWLIGAAIISALIFAIGVVGLSNPKIFSLIQSKSKMKKYDIAGNQGLSSETQSAGSTSGNNTSIVKSEVQKNGDDSSRTEGSTTVSRGEGKRNRLTTVSAILDRCYGSNPPKIPGSADKEASMLSESVRTATKLVAELGSLASGQPLPNETKIGKAIVEKFVKKDSKSENEALRQRVEKVLGKLVAISPRANQIEYESFLLGGDTINAAMLPGGKILVWEKLAEILTHEDQLAFIIGHELAHAELHHLDPVMQMSHSTATAGKVIGVGNSEVASGIGALFANVLASTYDQDQEFESDRLGLCLAYLSGYNAKDAAEAIKKVTKNSVSQAKSHSTNENQQSNEKRLAYNILNSHPDPEERIAYLRTLSDKLKP